MPGFQVTRPISWPADANSLAAVLAAEALGPALRDSGTGNYAHEAWAKAYGELHAAIVKTLH